MKEVMILVGMMLKEKLNIKYSWKFKNILRNFLPYIIKIALVAGISYLFFYFAAKYNIFTFNNFVPLRALSFIITFILILLCISSVIDFTKTLYFSEENKILLTYPISTDKIYFSKLIVFYITSFSTIFTFIYPIFIAYGIINNIGIAFYFWATISMLFLALVPLIFDVILAVPTYYIMQGLNKFKLLRTILFSIFIIGLAALAIYIIAIIPNNLNLFYFWPRIYRFIHELLTYFGYIFAPFIYLTMMTVGAPVSFSFTYLSPEVWITLAVLIGGSAIIIFFGYLINHKKFKKISSESLEGVKELKISKKKKENKAVDSQFLAIFKKEFTLIFRNDSKLTSLLYLYLFTPVLTFLVIKIFNALYLSTRGIFLAYMFSLLVILIPILTSNYVIASMFSSEGQLAINSKTNPLTPIQQMFARLVLPLTFSLISLIVSLAIFATFSLADFNFIQYLLLTLAAIFIQVGTMLFAASRDIDNPKTKEYTNNSAGALNKNEIVTFFFGLLVSAIFALYFYVLINENIEHHIWVVVKLFIVSTLYLIGEIFLFKGYIKSKFYEEGER